MIPKFQPSSRKASDPVPVAAPVPTNSSDPRSVAAIGKLPIKAGELYSSSPAVKAPEGSPYLPEQVSIENQNRLVQLGWDGKSPMPPEIGQRLKAIREEAQAERDNAKHDLPAGWQPPVARLVDIADLPEDEQAKFRKIFAEHDAKSPADQVAANLPESVHPEVRTALFLQEKAAAAAAGQAAAEPASVTNYESSTATASPHTAMTGELPQVCPRCEWPVSRPHNVEITDTDKHVFVAATLGQKRFTKTYARLGGQLQFRFRTLSTREQRLIRSQLVCDTRKLTFSSVGEFQAQLLQYHYVAAVAAIDYGGKVEEFPSLDEYQTDEPAPGESTVLPEWVHHFYTHVISQATVEEISRGAFQEFSAVVSMLELQASKADFWKGIESAS